MNYRLLSTAFVLMAALAACGSEAAPPSSTASSSAVEEGSADAAGGAGRSFKVQVWADNWMAVYVDGVMIGEDSVPITTERSFNAETFSFRASYPFTVAIEAKDFKETDSGIEYIGERNQQMGDGGVIAQIVDTSTGDVVAATNASWRTFVLHRAPLNTDCEKSSDPETACRFEIVEPPADWALPTFDDAAWAPATVWSADDVSPKGGYDDIDWDRTAALVWGADLEVDNTVLLRFTVTG